MNDITAIAGVLVLVGAAAMGTGCDRSSENETSEYEVKFDDFDEPSAESTEGEAPSASDRTRAGSQDRGAKPDAGAGTGEEGSSETAETEIQVLGVENEDDDEDSAQDEPQTRADEETTDSSDESGPQPRPQFDSPVLDNVNQIQLRHQGIPSKLREVRRSKGTITSGSSEGGNSGGGESSP